MFEKVFAFKDILAVITMDVKWMLSTDTSEKIFCIPARISRLRKLRVVLYYSNKQQTLNFVVFW